jgi:hypothetical protein
MQDFRIQLNNQTKALDRDAKKADADPEPHDALDWTLTQFTTLEGEVGKFLKHYTENHPLSWFFERTIGIGPVLAAGLLAHIDIRKAPTAGHIWRFAGLDPTQTWEKKTKRPWNAELKKLCWKVGDSFVKFSNHPNGFYGRIYRERKAYEWQRNLAGGNAENAAKAMERKRFGASTDAHAWLSGQCDPEKARDLLELGQPVSAAACAGDGVAMLPPAQIDARARRYAVKIFLSHMQECWWEQEYGEKPPKPFAIAALGHAHYIQPPQVN